MTSKGIFKSYFARVVFIMLIVFIATSLTACSDVVSIGQDETASATQKNDDGLKKLEVDNLDRNEIVLGTWSYPPYQFADSENFSFIERVIVESFEAVDIKVTIEYYPWNRCEHLVDEGIIWGAFPYVSSEKRIEKFVFSDPILEFAFPGNRLFYMKDTINLDGITLDEESLKEYRIGAAEGFWYNEYFHEHGIEVEGSPDQAGLFDKLIHRRLDLVPAEKFVGQYYLKSNYPEESNLIGMTEFGFIHNDPSLRIMLDKENEDYKWFMDKFNEGFEIILEQGIYDELYQDFLTIYNLEE